MVWNLEKCRSELKPNKEQIIKIIIKLLKMILVEEYQSDFEKGNLSFNLKPKYILSYYEGKYQDVEFEIIDGDGVYPTINWLEEVNFEDLKEIEEAIIKEFMDKKYK